MPGRSRTLSEFVADLLEAPPDTGRPHPMFDLLPFPPLMQDIVTAQFKRKHVEACANEAAHGGRIAAGG